jgi:hypothetical protein|tara:strand:- start:1372 stop:1971 length:600 start_codon:yes stop_codon:yes gene_type:complete
MPLTIVPEKDIPLPDDFEAQEPTTLNTKVKVAASTAKVLVEGGAEIPVSTPEKIEAEELFKVFTDPDQKGIANAAVNKSLATPATVKHLYAMLSDYDHQVVQEAVQLRRFVTNKLIEDTGLNDPRHRLKALELLGKISDVGLFSEKTEVIVKHATTEELEKQIRSKLANIIGQEKTINTSFEVIDDEMGTLEKEPEGEE